MHKKYKGVYDSRLIGMYKGHHLYFDNGKYVIERKYWKKPTEEELNEIKRRFGNLEKKIMEVKNDRLDNSELD